MFAFEMTYLLRRRFDFENEIRDKVLFDSFFKDEMGNTD